jgi:hypothetical protein
VLGLVESLLGVLVVLIKGKMLGANKYTQFKLGEWLGKMLGETLLEIMCKEVE